MLEKNLAALGFSPSETKVYLHLLKHGSGYAGRVSSETGINRTNVYEALERLVSKGVVSFISKNKVKWFEARAPDSLLRLMEEREDELRKTKNGILDDIQGLKSMGSGAKPLEANVFAGKKGLKMLFGEMLDAGEPISVLGAKLQFRKFFGHYFEVWHRRRIEKGIKQRSIFPLRFRKELKGFKKELGKMERETLIKYKFVDDMFVNPTATFIYGDTCVFVQWSDEPIGIRIQNRDIAKSHLNYFDMLWRSRLM